MHQLQGIIVIMKLYTDWSKELMKYGEMFYRKKLEEQVNISSLVGNDTSTIPVGNVLILLKDIYYPTKRAIV